MALSFGALAVSVHPAAAATIDDDLIVHYELAETSGTVAADTSGHANNAAYEGSPTLSGAEGVRLDGVDDDVKLPDNIMSGLSSMTVSTDVLIRANQATPYMIFALGNSSGTSGNGYVFATGDTFRSAIAPGDYTTEQGTATNANLTRGTWQHIAYTIDSTSHTATLYLNGTAVATNTNVTVKPSDIGAGATTVNYLARSVYSGDKRLAGSLRDFRIYDTALTANQVASLVPSATANATRDGNWATTSLGDLTKVTSSLTLPTAGPNGSTITWTSSDPAHLGNDGTVTRPNGTDAHITLTANATSDGASAASQVDVTVLGSNANTDAQTDLDAVTIPDSDDIRGNLTLPSTGTVHGSTITWSASPAGIISTVTVGAKPAGVVTRPAADTTVALTATVAGTTATRTINVKVKATPANLDTNYNAGYLFAHFATSDYEKINFGYSADGLHFSDLNAGQPLLANLAGTLGVRDPSIIRAPEGDRYWIIGTDLHAEGTAPGGSWDQLNASQKIVVWQSEDLVNWTFNGDIFAGFDKAGNVWAPEAYYDDASGQYYVYWAARDQRDNGTNNWALRVYLTKTRDFRTFTTPTVWIDANDPTTSADGPNAIDTTIAKDGDTYYRFTTSDWETIVDTATSLDGPWTRAINRGEASAHGLSNHIEGLTVYQLPDKHWIVMGDSGGYRAFEAAGDTLAGLNFTALTAGSAANQYSFAQTFRHGTVIRLSSAEQERLLNAYGPGKPAPATADGEILHYDFGEGAGTTVADKTGNGQTGTVIGTPTWDTTNGALQFNGTDTYVKLPNNLMTGLTDITVEADVNINQAQATPYFIYGLGNTSGTSGNGYLFTTGDRYRSSIAPGNYTTEQTAAASTNLPRGQWKHLVYTLHDGTATIYLDGAAVATKTGVTVKPGDIGGGTTTSNVLGKSLYNGDKLFNGSMRDFAIWNRALSPSEVIDLSGNDTQLTGFTLSDTSLLKTSPILNTTNRTVTFPVQAGTDLSKLAPTFIAATGATVSPASGATVDLRNPVDYTVTGTSGHTATWTLKAIEMKSPVIPGLYADPNIAVFGGTYYVYATTDGFAGWGGNTFYAWRSTDLVNWTRSEQPILTLDGASETGHVPWATGNAWAPTITEYDGKYYFYFSGQNPIYDRKTLGVAIADSPDGPFTAQPASMINNGNGEPMTTGQAIDADVFKDPQTGKFWIIWGNGSNPLMAQLNADMTSVDWTTVQKVTGLTSFREGSFINYRSGTYYLTYSIGDTGDPGYSVGYATASSVTGPYTYKGVILKQDPTQGIYATGHNSIIQVPGTDDWYIAYHRFAIPGGDGTHRETTIDKLDFNADGTIGTVTPTLTSVAPEKVPDPTPITVTITGESTVGSTLTAATGNGWTAAQVQWTRDGAAIDGATHASYTIVREDAGHEVGVQVHGSKDLWPDEAAAASAGQIKAGGASEPAVSRVTAQLSAPALRYGDADTVSVSVTGGTVTPTGTVAIYSGSARLGTGTLKSGRALIQMPARSLQPGTYRLAVRYDGDATHQAANANVNLTVVKAKPILTLGHTAKGRTLTLRIKITAGGPASGKVTVKVGKTRKRLSLKSDGTARIVLRRLPSGKHQVVITYSGSAVATAGSLHTVVRTR
jgi:GH43 family beta-xylosidase